MSKIDENLAPYGAFVLRVGLGTMWIAHALLKWFVYTIPGFAAWLGTQGLSGVFAWPVFLLLLIGGIVILLGFYGRYAALLMIPFLLVITWTHYPNGWLHTNPGGGWEFPVFLIVVSLACGLMGDGAFAVKSRHKLI